MDHVEHLEQTLLALMSADNRAVRLTLPGTEDKPAILLMPQQVRGTENMCGGFEYRVYCVATDAHFPLKTFIGLAAELQLVTDRGELHSVCGLVTQVQAGQSDGGLATYQLVIRDAFALLEMRTNTRVFLSKNEIDIISVLLSEWRERNPLFAAAFEFEFAFELTQKNYPKRELTMQSNETDAAFIRRLLKRRGIAWFFRPGHAQGKAVPDDGLVRPPVHTLVMFGDARRLKENAAGSVRYHRFGATEERDTITAFAAVRTLGPGTRTGFSWDYADSLSPAFMMTSAGSEVDQGRRGNRLAAGIDDYRIETPHVGNDHADHAELGRAQMGRHDYETKQFHGESNVRDLRVGEWIGVEGHAEIDTHEEEQRRFVITSLRVTARNNMPKGLDARVDRLFAVNRWHCADGEQAGGAASRYANMFTCVRRGTRIVPAYDPALDTPRVRMQSAIVVGPAGEEVHCDQQGRVKVRFPGMRPLDHVHAQGVGASNTDADSAWLRVAAHWAGNGPGSQHQFGSLWLPRVGSEVLIDFMDGDPDKPIIVGQLYNQPAIPPGLSRRGELPGNRFLSGVRSREIQGARGNQLCIDDTPGQISAQLGSDHGQSELNLGWLTEPRANGAGAPRGEGGELRSDEYIALRAAKGLLLTAWRRLEGGDAKGRQMARGEYLGLLRDCSELFGSLGKYAEQHEALALDVEAQEALQSMFKNWENGSNTAPKAMDGGAPVIGVTAPAGISFATSQAIVSYAGSNIDSVAQQHLQLTSGQRFNLNAGKGVSIFSHHQGIRAIAHHGDFLIQSQHDDTVINSAKNVKVTATDGKVVVMAKSIELIAEDGSFIKIGGGITYGSNSPMNFHAPDFIFDAPATMAATFPVFDTAGADQRVVVVYDKWAGADAMGPDDADSVASDIELDIGVSDGSSLQGRSDDAGKSDIISRDAMHMAAIKIMSDKQD